jgi:hypothetical protein
LPFKEDGESCSDNQDTCRHGRCIPNCLKDSTHPPYWCQSADYGL